jgi:hypothetical protein
VGLPGERARRGLSLPVRAATDVAGTSLGLALAGVAAVRRGKAVHPHGVVHAARLVVPGGDPAPPGAQLLSRPGEHAAIVRFSRSLGLPRPVPDLLGMSIRLPDVYGAGRHQDFLLVTSADVPVLNRGFLPARDVWQRPYTSSLPYRAGDRKFIVGALPQAPLHRPSGETELDRLGAAAASGGVRFRLAVAGPLGHFEPVAELHVRERLDPALDAMRFDPWNCGGGLEPAGFLNRLRDYAYPLSQAAWRITRRSAMLRVCPRSHAASAAAGAPTQTPAGSRPAST